MAEDVPAPRYPSPVAPRAPLLLLLALAACKSTPPPPPATESSSVVAIMLKTEPDREPHTGHPKTAYFVKLADEGDALQQSVLLRSDYAAEGVLYLMNAAPGRYAAVACYGAGEGHEWTAYFPEDLIRASAKQVPAGKVVLLGSFDVDLRSISTNGDEAQHYYMRLLFPKWEKQSQALRLFTRDDHAWGGPWRDAGNADDVLARMRKSLGPAWERGFEGPRSPP